MPTFSEYYEERQRAYDEDGSPFGDQAFEQAKYLYGRMTPQQRNHLILSGHSLEDTWPFRCHPSNRLVEEFFKISSDGV